MTAREWLSLVREHAARIEGLHRDLQTLLEAERDVEPWATRGSTVYGSMGGTHSDPTGSEAQARIDGLAPRIAELRIQVDECERVVGDGLRVIDQVRRALGKACADVLEWYYIDCADTWSEVAWEMGASLSAVCRRRDKALRWLDATCGGFSINSVAI